MSRSRWIRSKTRPVAEILDYRAMTANSRSSSENPLDLSLPKKLSPKDVERPEPNATSITKIFAEQIARNKVAPTITTQTPRRRLKHHSMGEILTSTEVQDRLKEVEEKKRAKKRVQNPKPSTSGVKKWKK